MLHLWIEAVVGMASHMGRLQGDPRQVGAIRSQGKALPLLPQRAAERCPSEQRDTREIASVCTEKSYEALRMVCRGLSEEILY